jgi:Big-like domain-containing protein
MQRMKRSAAPLLALAAAGILASIPYVTHAGPGRAASIVIIPSGATLRVGNTVQFRAEARDRRGSVVPGVAITWRSSPASVVDITATGLATARQVGVATITARGGGKTAQLTIPVVGPRAGGGEYVAANLSQVNHVLADENWVYWTELSSTQARLRRCSRRGGAIDDLAVEPSQTARGLRISYIHLRQNANTLFWTRESLGFGDHWSIRSISKSGGASSEVLPEDLTEAPLLSNGWHVSGKYVIVVLTDPGSLGLPAETRIACFDTLRRSWTPLITGRFTPGKVRILAADESFVYVRAITDDFKTQMVRIDPEAAVNTFQTILLQNYQDGNLAEPGATDGANVYFWSRKDTDDDKLMSFPVGGGTPVVLTNGSFGTGLVTDGVNLFWARGETQAVRLPGTGGIPIRLQTGLFADSTLGGLAFDADSLFLAVQESGRSLSIIRVNK